MCPPRGVSPSLALMSSTVETLQPGSRNSGPQRYMTTPPTRSCRPESGDPGSTAPCLLAAGSDIFRGAPVLKPRHEGSTVHATEQSKGLPTWRTRLCTGEKEQDESVSTFIHVMVVAMMIRCCDGCRKSVNMKESNMPRHKQGAHVEKKQEPTFKHDSAAISCFLQLSQ